MLEWLDTTALAIWLRESPSIWANATVLTAHTMGMAVLVGASFVLDLRLLGIGRAIPLHAFRWVFTVVAIGLTVNLVTGVLLFIKNATVWGTAVPFLIKMAFVVASVATLLPIRKLVLNGEGDGRRLAIVSIIAWSSAVTAGRLLAYLVV